jgi:hypothetical protein
LGEVPVHWSQIRDSIAGFSGTSGSLVFDGPGMIKYVQKYAGAEPAYTEADSMAAREGQDEKPEKMTENDDGTKGAVEGSTATAA